jgi:hypothetical protein
MAMMGAVLGVVGGIVQGMGAMQAHNAQAKADEYNAAVAERNRAVIHEQTLASIDDQQIANRRNMNAIRGMFAANGLSFTGSTTDLVLDQFRTDALGIQRISYKGKLQEIEQTDKQNLDLMGAADEHSAAGLSLVSGILGGVSSGLNSMTRAA